MKTFIAVFRHAVAQKRALKSVAKISGTSLTHSCSGAGNTVASPGMSSGRRFSSVNQAPRGVFPRKMVTTRHDILDIKKEKGFLLSKCQSFNSRIQPQSGNNDDATPSQKENENQLTLPTILTLARVVAVPLLVSVYYLSPEATTAIFLLASFTDWLDGYLARKLQVITSFGAFLDPVADKLMVAAALVLLSTQPVPSLEILPLWTIPVPAIAIIGREITMSAIREWAASQGGEMHKVVAVSWMGKWKTATQMIAISLLLTARQEWFATAVNQVISAGGVASLYISSGLAVVSLAQYILTIRRFLIKN